METGCEEVRAALAQSGKSSGGDARKIEISFKCRKEIEKEMERYAWMDEQYDA